MDLTASLRSAQESLLAKLEAQALVLSAINLQRTEPLQIEIRKEYYSYLSIIPSEAQGLAQEASKVATSQRILQSLLFDEIKFREEQIHEAHEKTFSWIFDDNATSFKKWLCSSSDVFWVSGKAGSGKSTLMKFLSSHTRTREILQEWAGGQRLVSASYFFWNSGSTIQRSQLGLLQSLLYQVLRKCPELIPLASTRRWDADDPEDPCMDPWTRSELSTAIQNIVVRGCLSSRFCFFIDGLDEYDDKAGGDHYNLIQDLDRLAQTPGVKLCVTSRPWNVFVKRYEGNTDYMFKLQDLTSVDMQRYIRDTLEEDERFLRLLSSEPRSLTLVTQIKDKADGVFLWVYLVVRSLLRGLNENDGIEELEMRLAEIPTDLHDFYAKIVQTVDGAYWKYTIRTYQIASVAFDSVLLMESTALWRVSQDVDDSSFALRTSIESLSEAQREALQNKAKTSINKWCRDLIEVDTPKLDALDGPQHHTVRFLHRTVKDFLMSEEVQNGIFKEPVCRPSPLQALCRIYLAEAKAHSGVENRNAIVNFRLEAKTLARYARMCECEEKKTPVEVLQELDRTIDVVRRCSNGYLNENSRFPSRKLQYMLKNELIMYVKHMLATEPQLRAGLLNIIYQPKDLNKIRSRQLAIPSHHDIKDLLEQGLDPNEAFHGFDPDKAVDPDLEVRNETAWQCFLEHAHDKQHFLDTLDIARTMLQHGADPDVMVKVAKKDDKTHHKWVDAKTCLIKRFHEDLLDDADAGRLDIMLEKFRGRGGKSQLARSFRRWKLKVTLRKVFK